MRHRQALRCCLPGLRAAAGLLRSPAVLRWLLPQGRPALRASRRATPLGPRARARAMRWRVCGQPPGRRQLRSRASPGPRRLCGRGAPPGSARGGPGLRVRRPGRPGEAPVAGASSALPGSRSTLRRESLPAPAGRGTRRRPRGRLPRCAAGSPADPDRSGHGGEPVAAAAAGRCLCGAVSPPPAGSDRDRWAVRPGHRGRRAETRRLAQVSFRSSRGRIARKRPRARAARMVRQAAAETEP